MNLSNQYKPGIAIAPGETIQEVIEDRGITVSSLAKGIELHEELTKGLLTGSVRITHDIATRLEQFLEIGHSFWLNLERNYNETLLRLWDQNMAVKGGEVAE
ncbi:addiction module HigA family antidote [Paenibacillus sp. 1182]|uniref:helix-turn-helix transcriptional regulator n=1 Tax=Paenibacillus sp. 1182 TaxID=2806565 RepID=UPI001AE65E0B|nr:plasmid maintenance system antidote protein, XRE family [Paenibacillus sp. 1182]MBP1309248.1 addiction module HigA family antidote [Paenibacillus sp. 1182]